jgi:CRISPR-associated protein Cas4
MADVPTPSIIPARMLNEFAYCPRLTYLEWVQREWADSADTLGGKHAHRRVAEGEPARRTVHNRSVQLTSEKLGVTAVVDIIELEGNRARPVDYKKGRRPAASEGAYEPERVQLCVQGLLLREHGFRCNEGLIYYAGSKQPR